MLRTKRDGRGRRSCGWRAVKGVERAAAISVDMILLTVRVEDIACPPAGGRVRRGRVHDEAPTVGASFDSICRAGFPRAGEVAERLIAPVLKTGALQGAREFESPPLRQ